MLLHVFLHELGHHQQRLGGQMNTRRLDEDYAERFALKRFKELYPKYIELFGDPRKGE
jgi:hypothetical protein